MPTIAQLVAVEVAPLMKDAGFRRRGSEFTLDGPDGLAGVVSLRADNRGADGLLGVSLAYGVVTPALREYRASKGAAPFPFPSVDEALVWKEVRHPFHVVDRENTFLFPFRWALPDGQSARLGALLRRALVEEVIPGVRALFDTEVQVRMLHLPPDTGWRGFEPKAGEVLARLRYGPDDPRTKTALAALPPDDDFRAWVSRTYPSSPADITFGNA